MLDVEVVGIVENCYLVVLDIFRLLPSTGSCVLVGIAVAICSIILRTVGAVGGGDGDGVERDGRGGVVGGAVGR